LFGFKTKAKKASLSVDPYTLYQLDRKRLLELRYQPNRTSVEEDVIKCYDGLFSNMPIYDKEASEILEGKVLLQEDKVQKLMSKNEDIRNFRKQKCAKWLYKAGFYTKAASAKTVCASDFILATQSHYETSWWESPHPLVTPAPGEHRNTMMYDIIRRFDEYFLKLTVHYIPLVGEPVYAEELV
jgi:hypothetical protein